MVTEEGYGLLTDHALLHVDDYPVLLQPSGYSLQVIPVFFWRRAVYQNVADVRESEVQALQHIVYEPLERLPHIS